LISALVTTGITVILPVHGFVEMLNPQQSKSIFTSNATMLYIEPQRLADLETPMLRWLKRRTKNMSLVLWDTAVG
jgi:hypothetical protein